MEKKCMNKNEKYVVEQLERYYGRTLTDCYEKPSSAKQYAYDTIMLEMQSRDGWGLTVLSYNTFMFTCAYYAKYDNGQTYIVYHTPSKKAIIQF